jgi:hypothetical protein
MEKDTSTEKKAVSIPGFLAANMSSADLIKIFQGQERDRKMQLLISEIQNAGYDCADFTKFVNSQPALLQGSDSSKVNKIDLDCNYILCNIFNS